MNWQEREAVAAVMLRECRAALAARGSTVIHEAMGICAASGEGAADIVDWRHYPQGEVYDPASHAQYFYHRHPSPARTRSGEPVEHGHFHLFVRGEGIPAGIAPLLLPEIAVANAPQPSHSAPSKRGKSDEVCHLVAIAIDGRGEPIRLFTTNRWVTGETWYRADDVIAVLDRFRVGGSGPSTLLNRWIEALIRLFQPEVTVLLRNRDQAIMDWRWRRPRGNAFEDPRLEITSSFDIDLGARLAAVGDRAAGTATATGARGPGRLPSMAEGWGA